MAAASSMTAPTSSGAFWSGDVEQLPVPLNHVVGPPPRRHVEQGRPYFGHVWRGAGQPPEARRRVGDDGRQRLADSCPTEAANSPSVLSRATRERSACASSSACSARFWLEMSVSVPITRTGSPLRRTAAPPAREERADAAVAMQHADFTASCGPVTYSTAADFRHDGRITARASSGSRLRPVVDVIPDFVVLEAENPPSTAGST